MSVADELRERLNAPMPTPLDDRYIPPQPVAKLLRHIANEIEKHEKWVRYEFTFVLASKGEDVWHITGKSNALDAQELITEEDRELEPVAGPSE